MYALNLLRETPKESFQILHLYCYNLEKKNPMTVTHIKTSDDNTFEYFFMTIGCVIIFFYTEFFIFNVHTCAFTLIRILITF